MTRCVVVVAVVAVFVAVFVVVVVVAVAVVTASKASEKMVLDRQFAVCYLGRFPARLLR